jgi:hypothetical protein
MRNTSAALTPTIIWQHQSQPSRHANAGGGWDALKDSTAFSARALARSATSMTVSGVRPPFSVSAASSRSARRASSSAAERPSGRRLAGASFFRARPGILFFSIPQSLCVRASTLGTRSVPRTAWSWGTKPVRAASVSDGRTPVAESERTEGWGRLGNLPRPSVRSLRHRAITPPRRCCYGLPP